MCNGIPCAVQWREIVLNERRYTTRQYKYRPKPHEAKARAKEKIKQD